MEWWKKKVAHLESQHSNAPILHRLIMAGEIELKLKEGDVAPEFSAATSGGNGDLPVWTGCVRPPHRQHLVPALFIRIQPAPQIAATGSFIATR
jgi:hypothetical protein